MFVTAAASSAGAGRVIRPGRVAKTANRADRTIAIRRERRQRGAVLLRTLLLVGGLLPLAAMIAALFAAAWIREGRRAEAAPARRSSPQA